MSSSIYVYFYEYVTVKDGMLSKETKKEEEVYYWYFPEVFVLVEAIENIVGLGLIYALLFFKGMNELLYFLMELLINRTHFLMLSKIINIEIWLIKYHSLIIRRGKNGQNLNLVKKKPDFIANISILFYLTSRIDVYVHKTNSLTIVIKL